MGDSNPDIGAPPPKTGSVIKSDTEKCETSTQEVDKDALKEAVSAPSRHPPITISEQSLLNVIACGDVEAALALLAGEDPPDVNCLDAHGMTPIMHAAHQGSIPMCELLLQHGADVNSDKHDFNYTALMFAGIAGNLQVTELLLANGAKPLVTNSVGRNAAQMAAFVGQHRVASFINNFIPREELEAYTKPQGLENEAELPLDCLQSFHRLILSQNIHPTYIGIFIQRHPCLLENRLKVVRLLEKLCGKWFKAKNPTAHNEARAIKMNYLACIVREMGKSHVCREDMGASFIKMLMKLRDSDMFPAGQEKFIRQTLREFPYSESDSLQGMVRTLANTQIGHRPSALDVLNTAVNGPAIPNQDDRVCDTCGSVGAQKRCAACKMSSYCDSDCQKLHWFTHKKFCKDLQQRFKKIQAAAAATAAEGSSPVQSVPMDAAKITADLNNVTINI